MLSDLVSTSAVPGWASVSNLSMNAVQPGDAATLAAVSVTNGLTVGNAAGDGVLKLGSSTDYSLITHAGGELIFQYKTDGEDLETYIQFPGPDRYPESAMATNTSASALANVGTLDARYLVTGSTTNKALVDAAIAAAVADLDAAGNDYLADLAADYTDVDVVIFHDAGNVTTISSLSNNASALTPVPASPLLRLTNCVAYIMRPITLSNYRFPVAGTNFTLNGQHNLITVNMSGTGYTGNECLSLHSANDSVFENLRMLWNISSTHASYTNLTVNPYLVNASGNNQATTNYVIRNSSFQLNYLLNAPSDGDNDFIKAFVDTKIRGDSIVDNCTFSLVAPNSSNRLFSWGATHSASGDMVVNNCRFVATDNMAEAWHDGASGNTTVIGSYVNRRSYANANGYESRFGLLAPSYARSLLIDETYWPSESVDVEAITSAYTAADTVVSNALVEAVANATPAAQWTPVHGYNFTYAGAIAASTNSTAPFISLSTTQDSMVLAPVSLSPGETGTVQLRAYLRLQAGPTTNAIYRIGQRVLVENGTTASAVTSGYTYVTNATPVAIFVAVTNTLTGITGEIAHVGLLRKYNDESGTDGKTVQMFGGQKIKVY
jgi:hypothetical protein